MCISGGKAMKTNPKTQETWVEAIKSCGQSLIDNAEEIAGDYEFETGVDITISLKPQQSVEIKVATTYLPKARDRSGVVALTDNQLFAEQKAVI